MFQDKAFITGLVDTVVSLALYFIGKYAGKSVFEDVKVVLVAIQPFAIALILYFLKAEVVATLRGLR